MATSMAKAAITIIDPLLPVGVFTPTEMFQTTHWLLGNERLVETLGTGRMTRPA